MQPQRVESRANLTGDLNLDLPFWDVTERALYWAGIERAVLQRFEPAMSALLDEHDVNEHSDLT